MSNTNQITMIIVPDPESYEETIQVYDTSLTCRSMKIFMESCGDKRGDWRNLSKLRAMLKGEL
jgi:hypothetical protein